jgi:hypothetical protein
MLRLSKILKVITRLPLCSLRKAGHISHKLDKEYEVIPHIILTNQCNCFIYIFDIKQEGTQITITLAIGNNFDADLAKYQLLALPY